MSRLGLPSLAFAHRAASCDSNNILSSASPDNSLIAPQNDQEFLPEEPRITHKGWRCGERKLGFFHHSPSKRGSLAPCRDVGRKFSARSRMPGGTASPDYERSPPRNSETSAWVTEPVTSDVEPVRRESWRLVHIVRAKPRPAIALRASDRRDSDPATIRTTRSAVRPIRCRRTCLRRRVR